MSLQKFLIISDFSTGTGRLLRISHDKGRTWSTPVILDTPDSRAKKSAGNLPDGTGFMVNNLSGNKDRFRLEITLSVDGFFFNRAFLIRSVGKDIQAVRFEG